LFIQIISPDATVLNNSKIYQQRIYDWNLALVFFSLSLILLQNWGHDGVSQLYSAVQTADHMYSLVQLGTSPFCKPNNAHAKYIYSQINASLRDIRISGQNDVRLRAIAERNAKPTIANTTAWILETNPKLKNEDIV
jgi:hypothetical protein